MRLCKRSNAGAGTDTLNGGGGGDILIGGAGADIMNGGSGDDIYDVDNVGDVINDPDLFGISGGIDTINSHLTSYTLGTTIENLSLQAGPALNGTGNAKDNLLLGNSGNNVLLGLGGNDRLDGGNGNDKLDGGAGIDNVEYQAATAGVTVDLNKQETAQPTGGAGTDTLVNIENIIGSAFNDTLTGNAANNTLNGGSGNDTLIGGAGRDTLFGAGGNDRFDYNAPVESLPGALTRDVIPILKEMALY